MDTGDDGERELLRFGPLGISVFTARPGLFVWSQQNNTEIVLTDRRLFGRKDAPAFEDPLGGIISAEPADFHATRAVWIRYRTPDGMKEVSIIGAALCHGHIARLMDLLLPFVDAPGDGKSETGRARASEDVEQPDHVREVDAVVAVAVERDDRLVRRDGAAEIHTPPRWTRCRLHGGRQNLRYTVLLCPISITKITSSASPSAMMTRYSPTRRA